ncbi:uncharacterized protein LOC109605070 [Aethina tumida]|uniref:uncharacterized protein LOC109605070 n=1 Tax=Aethina tumida TaxID=116153 RepID=UPI00096B23F8|nr:uncharacterized protein LOC109605070 [Aethina tumida]
MDVLPVEIIELILMKCDGKTLLNCRHIDDKTAEIVDYLSQKTQIWKWCCNEDIPKNEMVDYCRRYTGGYQDYRKWLHIYQNWYAWHNPSDITCKMKGTPVEISRISCLAVLGNLVAVGSEDGRLKVYRDHWQLLHSSRHFSVRIIGVEFLCRDDKNLDEVNILIAFSKGFKVMALTGPDERTIYGSKSYSVFQDHICYETEGGRTTISKIQSLDEEIDEKVLWFSRIYSPTRIVCQKMWNGVCTFLINDRIKYVRYENPEITPMEALTERTSVDFNFTLRDNSYKTQIRKILRDEAIVSTYKNDSHHKSEYIEFCLLNETNGYSTKLFNSSEIFNSSISCIHLYGNTLILGVDIGNIYIYHVGSWKNLNLRDYDRKIIVGRHPIMAIDVKETESERIFYIASKFCVHELSGFSVKYK